MSDAVNIDGHAGDPFWEADPLLGTLVGGRYRLRGVIGRGGMGVVYDAVHEELGRPVAIKVVSSQHAQDTTVIDRFLREARVVAQIGHPNIVAVHDLGRLEDQRPYLVMERLYGSSFYELLHATGKMEPVRVAELLDGAASALEVVHAKGIVHRDIKLENLMLARSDDNTQVVKLLDFGIAAIATFSPDAKRITKQGMITGTPLYIAPEAATGERPDHRADIYSLAVVTYSLLTGFAPFDSDNPVVILSKKLAQDAPRLSVGGDRFSEALEEVMARGLARHPEDRYGSAKQFVRDLKNAAYAPVSAPMATPLPRSAPTPEPGLLTPADSNPFATATDIVRDRKERSVQSPPPPPARSSTEELLRQGGVSSRERVKKLLPASLLLVGSLAVIGFLRGVPSNEPPSVEVVRIETPPAPEVKAPDPIPTPTQVPVKTEEPQKKLVVPVKHVEKKEPAPKQREPDGPDVTLPAVNRARAEQATKEGMKALIDGLIPSSIERFRDATLAAPRYAPAWRGLGLANDKMGRKSEALRAFKQYLTLSASEDAAVVATVRDRVSALEREQ